MDSTESLCANQKGRTSMKCKEVKRMEAEARNARYQGLPRAEKLKRNSKKVWRKLLATAEELKEVGHE